MAYAAAASFSHTIDILLTYHQNCFNPKFNNLIISLQKQTKFFLSFLEDFPEGANIWEEIIRETADMGETILELILSDSLLGLASVGSSRSNLEKGREYQLPYGFDELVKVAQEMESIANRVKGIQSEYMDGPADELMNLISQLCTESSWSRTIAIYGREGMGKTSLAKNVYNHPLIVEHFEVRAWCTASTEFGLLQIASQLHRTMKFRRSRSDSEDEVNKSLYDYLHGRKYLIVLDDLKSIGDLRRLKKMLPFDEENGSRILITTRVFRFFKTVHYFHEMRFLNVDEAWKLVKKKIFQSYHYPCPLELDHIGRKIVNSCRGHPLFIEVVSGILGAAAQTIAAWEEISESINFASEDIAREILQVVSLGYAYLPHHLRPCFLYLVIFPKNEEISVSKLVKLWAAEGFLNENECKSFEETGEECVEDLVRRNLVSVSKRKTDGRIKSVEISGTMRDMCLRQAHRDNFILEFDQKPVAMELHSCRRVRTSFTLDFLEGMYGSTLRTIILSLGDSEVGTVRWSIGNVRLLRVLDLANAAYNYDLPDEVFELFHLRYLSFDYRFSISEAISNLENLQTLIIFPRENSTLIFDNMPDGIWSMPQLRHLLLFSFKLPTQKVSTPALENLQTLSRVVDFICSRENLKMIPNLKKLALFYTEGLSDVVVDYELDNLIYLNKLENLKIEMNWSSSKRYRMSCTFPPTLKKLSLSGEGLPWENMKIVDYGEHMMRSVFPPTLRELSLSSVGLLWEDMEIVGLLPNLEVLKLRKLACIDETWKTNAEGFANLTFLLIEESNLKNWISKRSHFPSLKSLVLRTCLHLLELPGDIIKIYSLELIELDDKNHSLLSSLQRIEMDGRKRNDRLQIRVV